MTEATGNGGITYSVKELLARIELKVDGLTDKLDAKAEKTDFLMLSATVTRLEANAASADAVNAYRRWLFGFATFGIVNFGMSVFLIIRPHG